MILPIQTDVPMERWPIVNWVIMALTIIVSVWGFGDLDGFALPSGLLNRENPQLSQLITHQFYHAGFWHLVGNMIFLFVFGNAVNARLGHLYFVPAYLLCGAAAGLAWLAMGQGGVMLGASGAIMGMMGLFVVYYPRNDVRVGWWFIVRWGSWYLSAWIVVAAYFVLDVIGSMRAGTGVASIAHVGGSIAGFLMAVALLKSGLVRPGPHEEPMFQPGGR